MANNIIEKNQNISYNSVPHQQLTYANQLTINSWNDIINILKTQANINAEYLDRLHTWLIGNYDSMQSFANNSITIPTDELVFGDYSPSFAEYVLREIKYLIENPIIIKKEATVNMLESGTLVNPTQASVNITGNGRHEYPETNNKPLEFEFNIPKGLPGYGIHFFGIDEQGNLIMYRERQEQFGDEYYIDPVTGSLCISFETEE